MRENCKSPCSLRSTAQVVPEEVKNYREVMKRYYEESRADRALGLCTGNGRNMKEPFPRLFIVMRVEYLPPH